MTYLSRIPPCDELVRREIQALVVSSFRSTISIGGRTYTTTLRDLEGTSALFLASRLVWAATYLQGWRHATKEGRHRGSAGLRLESLRAQIAFVEAVGEEPHWLNGLREQRDAAARVT